VDNRFIGGGCIELNPNPPRSSSNLCALISDGSDEEKGICECERGEVRRLRSCGGEYGGSRLMSLERMRGG